MRKLKEKEIVGYKIEPGVDTIENSPLAEFTRDVCKRCIQPSDKRKYAITRSDVIERSTVCDRCFRELGTGMINDNLYEQVTKKDLVAFYYKKKTLNRK